MNNEQIAASSMSLRSAGAGSPSRPEIMARLIRKFDREFEVKICQEE